jgi:UDP-N-acetylmuramoyl-tripeptide--D-alanyl-D-alanine ligase
MLELGEFSSDLHAELAGPILDAHPDLVLLCGPEMKGLDGALERLVRHEWFASPDELRESLVRHLRQGDVVMAKASKSIGFSKIVDDLIRIHTPSAEAASGMSAPSDLGQGA